MKKLLFLMLGISCYLISMEPQDGHKDRVSTSSSSSGSGGEVSAFENVGLHRKGSPTLDTARLQQQGKIVITDADINNLARLAALEEELKKKGSRVENSDKRRSVIYMPQLDLLALERDLSGGSVQKQKKRGEPADLEKGNLSEEWDKEALKQAYEFFVHYYKDKHNSPDLDLKAIEKDLLSIFKRAHNSPPSTPNDKPEVQKDQKTKQALAALRKGSVYQATARTRRAQLPQSPALSRAREPRPLEILSTIINEPEVHESIQTVEQMVVSLLAQKHQEAQNTLTNTRWGGGAVSLVGMLLTGVITNIITKKSC